MYYLPRLAAFSSLLVIISIGEPAAAADLVRIRCNDADPGIAFTVDINLQTSSVYVVYDDGRGPQSSQANINSRFITWRVMTWNVQTKAYSGQYILERMDRATGILNWSQGGRWLSEGSCKRLERGPVF